MVLPSPQTLITEINSLTPVEQIATIQKYVGSTEKCEEECFELSKEIGITAAMVTDLSYFINELKKKCLEDGAHIVETKNQIVTLLIQKEKMQFEEELKKNSFRKAQMFMEFSQKEKILNGKIRMSELLFDQQKTENTFLSNNEISNNDKLNEKINENYMTKVKPKIDGNEQQKENKNDNSITFVQNTKSEEKVKNKMLEIEDSFSETEDDTQNTEIIKQINDEKKQNESIDIQNENKKPKRKYRKRQPQSEYKNLGKPKKLRKKTTQKMIIIGEDKTNTFPKDIHNEDLKEPKVFRFEANSEAHKTLQEMENVTQGDIFNSKISSNSEEKDRNKKGEISMGNNTIARETNLLKDQKSSFDSIRSTELAQNMIRSDKIENSPTVVSQSKKTISKTPQQFKKQIEYDENYLSSEDKKQLQTWSGQNVGPIIYDVFKDLSVRGSNGLIKKISKCDGFILTIEDYDGNLFGAVVFKSITSENVTFGDKEAFVFTLKENGKKKCGKYNIKEKRASFAFCAESRFTTKLLDVGNGDIKVAKMNHDKVFCEVGSNSFEYEGEKCLCNKGMKEFEIKHLMVYRMEK
ncbi:hypothetical protein EIN_455280 [Entamoeba invadens IP1]|uniref:TLDc domain-containing protein n=1 Tax=Entamoeba invadens IP1 TaxID=370355 RepID=L7FMX8_ENTIV|nr:hypothetical protein EIN_455280 [Entamoeba invadens IP1]ELP89718.1 hypothetical protein EIN_455280 [Entamoeba invadens IP1]|eukprot:XP_004256489.1 hypothetical protein EIN_455280 [Entamoeba invadens IP1]